MDMKTIFSQQVLHASRIHNAIGMNIEQVLVMRETLYY